MARIRRWKEKLLVAWFTLFTSFVWARPMSRAPEGANGAAQTGTISGAVLDQASRPVAQAEVFASNISSHVPISMVVPWAYTDANGHFVIRRLPWGTYVVEAAKPGAGYPPAFTFTNFYGHRRAPKVTVSPQAPGATVVVRMFRNGVLSGSVVDARTGQLVTKVRYVLRREGYVGAETSATMHAHFALPVPSEMALTFTVRAPGFEPWRETVNLNSGERKALAIRLRPLAPEPGSP